MRTRSHLGNGIRSHTREITDCHLGSQPLAPGWVYALADDDEGAARPNRYGFGWR
jgi:hypothetical protein